jgi:hypothetical protein
MCEPKTGDLIRAWTKLQKKKRYNRILHQILLLSSNKEYVVCMRDATRTKL